MTSRSGACLTPISVTPAAAPRADSTAANSTILRDGELNLDGRLVVSSNAAFVGSIELDGQALRCVYKPIRGERPLWDFPEGTLAGREVAAFEISHSAQWECVPETILRDGPFGPGMVQEWIDDADPDLAADLLPAQSVPDDWLPVLSVEDQQGQPLVLAHADTPELALLAAFDVVVNNADRKAPHILPTRDGRLLGVDHGLTMHCDPKLRTILWGWAGEPLPDGALAGLQRLRNALAAELGPALAALISTNEIAALRQRVEQLLTTPVYPVPPSDRSPIPWPPL